MDVDSQASVSWVVGTGPLGWISLFLGIALYAAYHVLVIRPRSTFSSGRWTCAISFVFMLQLIAIGRAEQADLREWLTIVLFGALGVLIFYVGLSVQNRLHGGR